MGPTVLVVDDHEAFRAAAALLLRASGFAVVGEAADGEGGIRAAAQLRPDLVLLDVQLPDMDGFRVAQRLAELDDPPRVLLTSTRDAAAYAARLGAGALRFVRKDELTPRALLGVIA